MTEPMIDLPDLKAKAEAVAGGSHGPHERLGAEYRKAASPETILILIEALNELETWRYKLLQEALVCTDARDLVKGLVKTALDENVTVDGEPAVAY